MEDKTRKYQETPEGESERTPSISPEMIRTTFETLETKGMIYYSEGGVYIPTAKGWQLLMKTGATREEIVAYGHPDITANHDTMIKLTAANDVNNDSAVIGVKASKVGDSFSKEFKEALKKGGKKIDISIEAGDIIETLSAYTSPALRLKDRNTVSISKTDRIDDSTIAIMSDKAANDLSVELVKQLKNPDVKIKVILEIKS